MIKKVYEAEDLICSHCGGEMRFLGMIEEPLVIEQILHHLGLRDCVAIFCETCWDIQVANRSKKLATRCCLRRPAFVLRPPRRSTARCTMAPTMT